MCHRMLFGTNRNPTNRKEINLSISGIYPTSQMNYMFWKASSFNQPLNEWNVSNVTNIDENGN